MSRVATPRGKMVLPDGAIVRGYRVSHIATGGMAVVYRASRQGRDYVLKEVPADQPKLVLALTQEKGILERIDHPQIVRFVALFEEAGYYYLVVDYIAGKPLDAVYNRENPISEDQARNYGGQLCGIFSYLHGLSPPIIYRDLKPSNVMLVQSRVYLIDFGIARVYKGDRVHDTEAWGSFTSSPEHQGLAETDQRSDVFTLGATLYDLLVHGTMRDEPSTGLPPVRELRPDVSAELEGILQKAMAPSPEDRFQTMAEFREALARSDGPATMQFAPPVPVEATVEKPRSPRPRWLAAGVGALLAVGLLGGALLGGRPKDATEEPDTGFRGNVFSSYEEGTKAAVVTLGADIGLFRISGKSQMNVRERTRRLVDRLNQFYHERCPTCGHMRLESEGFRVGRYHVPEQGVDETVVFYSHHEPELNIYRPPVLLAAIDETQARKQNTTKKYVAGYWRDLLRDLVRISRGQERGALTALGVELHDEMLQARKKLGPDVEGFDGVRAVMSAIGAADARRLQHLFERVPSDYKFTGDSFDGIENYQPIL